MDFYISSTLITVAILIAYFNHRFIKLQATIALMVATLFISIVLLLLDKFFGLYDFEQQILTTLNSLDFENLLINGMLSFLLFAGALTIDLHSLKDQRWEIFTLSSLGTILSAFLVAIGTYYLLPLIGIHLNLIYCLLFGALISPTDPIAVLATFKQLQAPAKLSTTVAGESLFNDGVGIVMFISFYHVAFSHEPISSTSVLLLFLQQAIGGILYGILLGYIGSFLIKHADEHKIEILITIAIATGGYALAQASHISGPLAMVVAGIIIGTHARQYAMSEQAKLVIDQFWEIIDELLNCVLFLLIGFELLPIAKGNKYLLAGLFAIPLVLIVRGITVILPMSFFKLKHNYSPYMTQILIWGGLRGGLAVALALSLPPGNYRQLILAMTYAVVTFSVIVQGLTMAPMVKFALKQPQKKIESSR